MQELVKLQPNPAPVKVPTRPRGELSKPQPQSSEKQIPVESSTKAVQTQELSRSEAVNREEVERAVHQLNDTSRLADEKYNFSIHEETGRFVVQVADREGEVVRQMPSEDVLELAANLRQMIGVFLDENA